MLAPTLKKASPTTLLQGGSTIVYFWSSIIKLFLKRFYRKNVRFPYLRFVSVQIPGNRAGIKRRLKSNLFPRPFLLKTKNSLSHGIDLEIISRGCLQDYSNSNWFPVQTSRQAQSQKTHALLLRVMVFHCNILRIDFDALLPGAILRWKMFAFCHLLLNRKRQRRNEVTRFAWHTESLVLF